MKMQDFSTGSFLLRWIRYVTGYSHVGLFGPTVRRLDTVLFGTIFVFSFLKKPGKHTGGDLLRM